MYYGLLWPVGIPTVFQRLRLTVPCIALTTGKLPAVRAVQETVKESIISIKFADITTAPIPANTHQSMSTVTHYVIPTYRSCQLWNNQIENVASVIKCFDRLIWNCCLRLASGHIPLYMIIYIQLHLITFHYSIFLCSLLLLFVDTMLYRSFLMGTYGSPEDSPYKGPVIWSSDIVFAWKLLLVSKQWCCRYWDPYY